MKHYNRLIFVDADDTRRAPMAEMLMKQKFLLEPVEILSRGLMVLFDEPIDPKTAAVLTSNGFSVEEFRSAPLVQEDITEETLILTMEDKQKSRIWELFENASHVYTMSEFIHIQGDIAPLYGRPLADYSQCFEVLTQIIDELVIRLNGLMIRR